jgi:hypothetical protein
MSIVEESLIFALPRTAFSLICYGFGFIILPTILWLITLIPALHLHQQFIFENGTIYLTLASSLSTLLWAHFCETKSIFFKILLAFLGAWGYTMLPDLIGNTILFHYWDNPGIIDTNEVYRSVEQWRSTFQVILLLTIPATIMLESIYSGFHANLKSKRS